MVNPGWSTFAAAWFRELPPSPLYPLLCFLHRCRLGVILKITGGQKMHRSGCRTLSTLMNEARTVITASNSTTSTPNNTNSSPLYKLLRPSKPAPNTHISFADEHLRLQNTPTHSRLLPVQATKRPLSSPCYAYYCTVIDGERTHRIRQAYLQNQNCCLLVQNFIVFTACQ